MVQSRHTMPRFSPVVLPLLLLIMYGTLGCLAADPALNHRCMFDEMMKKSGPLPTAVVREVPRKGQGTMQAYTVATDDDKSGWAPIRIVVSTEDMKNPLKYCNATGVLRSDFRTKEITCEPSHVLTEEKKSVYTGFLLPQAVKLHADRLRVKPVSGNLTVPSPLPHPCYFFTIPPAHRVNGTGVPNADMVLYAAAGPMVGKVAFATSCAVLDDGRPSVGVVNYNPEQIIANELAVRILAHEIAHALGFAIQHLKNKSLVNSEYALVRGKRYVKRVEGNTVKAKAAAHFGCPNLGGMELEDDFWKGVESHWERRHAMDELMAPTVRAGRYTALTMAAFADLGYYDVDWRMAEPMNWGNNTGCGFLEKKCTEVSNLTTAYPHMFCDASDNATLRCTSSRHHVGRCTGIIHDGNDDKCPVVSSFFGTPANGKLVLSRCSDANVTFLPGSLTGGNSWCLDAEALQVKGKSDGSESTNVMGVCAQVLCERGKVKVKYLGSSAFEECPEGGEIQVKASANFSEGGKIKCPNYSEVCIVAADGRSVLSSSEYRHRMGAGSSRSPELFSSGSFQWATNVFGEGSAAAVGLTPSLLLAVATIAAVAMLSL